LLKEYFSKNDKELKPVNHRSEPAANIRCPHCNAPYQYLYYNNGVKKSQLLCKVCVQFFPAELKFRDCQKAKFFCPYCSCALFYWKRRREVTIHKCCNDNCQYRVNALSKLTTLERALRKKQNSHFKLCYQYREYRFKTNELTHSAPLAPTIDISKIYNSQNVLGLVLTFFVSFANSARKTALILRTVFNISVSYQTVLNYAQASAYYCHQFNLKNKGSVDNVQAGDEAYIKVSGRNYFTFFFISPKRHKITAYHVADSRETLPAIVAMNEAVRTSKDKQKLTLVTDGNPSYAAGIHFLNQLYDSEKHISHRKVIGLQNLDSESTLFRPFKQLIERLNRTYKYHVRPTGGFSCVNGAVALTTLFATHYNFLRPHMALDYNVPIPMAELDTIATIQGKWAKIISLAA
jgi:putative transposase